ncbi:hypothetical protein G3436_21455 [Pseudomonas sp. MAFF212427]|uniref:Bacterial collagen-like protein middle domain-containing protein n=1 Tax=Pseudomonas brassicae TaxID=2708063 RepID=A0A6B3NRX2_9PSED|nr:hypothetical protein [Pseudomonas brassicae]
MGETLSAAPLVGSTGAGDLVKATGNAVTSIGTGLSNGVGQLGSGGNALGETLKGVGKGVPTWAAGSRRWPTAR